MNRPFSRHGATLLAALYAALHVAQPAHAAEPAANLLPTAAPPEALARLIAAYPDALERIDGRDLVWRDGTRMDLDDGHQGRPTGDSLDHASIADMLAQPYPAGDPHRPPLPGADPGRARNEAFFNKLYGDCTKGTVTPHLTSVAWLPKHGGLQVKMTALHGVADRLAAVSRRLDELGDRDVPYLIPTSGTYACRRIAGTGRVSAHGYGIAIDIAARNAHYWRWSKAGPGGALVYANEIPAEIVAAFEVEGFIWGGRWSHYDTMHFEYRPELFPPPVTGPK